MYVDNRRNQTQMSTLHIEIQTQIYNPHVNTGYSVSDTISLLSSLCLTIPPKTDALVFGQTMLVCYVNMSTAMILVKHRIPSNDFSFGHLQFYSCELYLLADHSMCTCNWVVVVGTYFHNWGKDKYSEITFEWCITAMWSLCRLDTIFIKIYRNFTKDITPVKAIH